MNPEDLLNLPGVEEIPIGGFIPPAEEDEEEGQPSQPVQEQPQQQPAVSVDPNLFQQAQDAVAGFFGQDVEERQEQRAQGQADNAALQEQFNEDSSVGAESVRAVVGGVAGVAEETVKAADLAGDTFKQVTGLNNGDQTQNPFSTEYERSDFNLGIAENKTVIGGFARNAITMLGMMKGARAIPGVGGVGLGAKSNIASRMGGEALRGAIADFIMDPGEGGNASNYVADKLGLEDTFLTALAHDDEDNIYIQKLKNMAEGAVFGLAVDGIGELYFALRGGKKVLKEGGSLEEAIDEVEDSLQPNVPYVNVNTPEIDELVSQADRLDQTIIRATDAGAADVSDLTLSRSKIIDQIPIQRQLNEYNGSAQRNVDLGNGDQALIRFESAGDDVVGDVIDTDWSLDEDTLNIGTKGSRNILRAYDKAFSELEPGTVVRNQPAPDEYAAGGPSKAQSRRTNKALDGWKSSYDKWMAEHNDLAAEGWPGGREDWEQLSPFSKRIELENLVQDGKIPPAPERSDAQNALGMTASTTDGIRARLYKRIGFGEVFNDNQYGVVRIDKKGRKRLEPINSREDIQAAIQRAKTPLNNTDPGFVKRLDEAKAHNANSVETNLYEPNERAAKTTAPEMQDVLESQVKYEAEGRPADAAPKTYTTEETYKYFVGHPNSSEAMASLIKAASQDIRLTDILELAKEGNLNPRMLEGLEVLSEVVDENGAVDISRLQKIVTEGSVSSPEYMTIKGGIVTRALMLDTAQQLTDIATAARQVDDVAGDSFRQSEMLIDRLETLSKMDIEASYAAGSNLQGRQNLPANARQAMELDGEAALKLDKSQKFIEELRGKLETGDPKAKQEFATMVDSLRLADGDPAKVKKFWEQFRQAGATGLKATMYNGYLSTTTSQIRSLTGNAVNLTLRPIAQAIGFGVSGNMTDARIQLAAFHGMKEMLAETWKIAKISWDDSAQESSQILRFDSGQSTAKQVIQNLKDSAETNGEKAAATFAEIQHNLFANPWMRMPTRAIGAVDDATRTLVARMELKKEAMRNSVETGAGFRVNEKRYAKLVELKINGKGNILDQELLDKAADVTFQRDLKFFGKDLQDMSEKYAAMKFFMPFIKTPTNILISTASYMPGWTRIPGSSKVPIIGQFATEYRAAMAGNDEALKALYKGREAIGFMSMMSATGLAANGLLTGNGPRDPEKRKLWLKTNQPNSIKTPWGWVDYSTIEPLNTIFSMAADTVQIAQAGNDSLYERTWAQAVYTIAAGITNKSYFKGLADAGKLMDPTNPAWAKQLERTGSGLVNTFAFPMAGARAQLGKLLAPGKQEFDNAFAEAMAQAIPGLRNVIGENRVDILTGKEIGSGLVNHAWNTLTPFDVQNEDNPVAKELGELGVDINLEFSDTFKGIDLSAKEKVMLQRYIYQTGLGSELKVLMEDPKFRANVEEWRASGGTLEPEPAWHKKINRKLATAKRRAKARMLRDNPTFAAKVRLNDRARKLANESRYDASQKALKTLEEIIDF